MDNRDEQEDKAYRNELHILDALYEELGREVFYHLMYREDGSGGFLEDHGIEQTGPNTWEVVA